MLEVFLTAGSAYVLKRLKVFSSEDAKVLVSYVIYLALPAVSFKTGSQMGVSAHMFYTALGAWLTIALCLFASYLVAWLLGYEERKRRALAFFSSFGNTAFLGYPFTHLYLGDEGLRYAVIYDQLGSFLLVSSVGFFLASGRLNLREMLFFPPFLALVLGFVSKGVALPEAFLRFVEFLSLSLLPVVLFALGLLFEIPKAFW